jgi:hypothetical protein
MAKKAYYVLKVKGKAKIPDYIQVRDESFTLIGYFRPGRNNKTGRMAKEEQALWRQIEEQVSDAPYGVVTKVEINET